MGKKVIMSFANIFWYLRTVHKCFMERFLIDNVRKSIEQHPGLGGTVQSAVCCRARR